MESPPKRVTRARAAAKKDDITTKTTKIATTASKAKPARATATTKRKTRADDDLEEDELQQDPETIIEPEAIAAPAKTARGRPKKVTAVQPEDEEMMDAPPVRATSGRAGTVETEQVVEAPIKTTRGRPKRIVVDTPAEQAKTTRTRAKKVEVEAEEPVQEPKRTTRGRAATVTKTAVPKKTVKFEEPDKENVVPITAAKEKAKAAETATGLRAKPVRKAAVPTRATRGRAKVEEKKEETSPLSPKKITQVGTTSKESQSEDELATSEKTPMRPLTRSPMKPPGSIFGAAKKLDFSMSNSITVNRMAVQDLSSSMMASPARRPPPQSPFKESIRTSPQRNNLQASLRSPFKPSLQAAPPNSSFKNSLLASPARRPAPASPTKVSEAGSPTRSEKTSLFGGNSRMTPFKISRFTTPRTLNLKQSTQPGNMMPPPSAPPKFATGSPKASLQDENTTMTIEPKLKFSGRLSSIMPRSADPALKGPVPAKPIPNHIQEEEETSPQPDGDVVDTITCEVAVEENNTPPVTPPRYSTGDSYEEYIRDESPFDDSDSEDELASASPRYVNNSLTPFEMSTNDFASSPVPFKAISTPKPKSARQSLAPLRSEKKERIGFTPLAAQLSGWMAPSPEKADSVGVEPTSPTASLSKSIEEQPIEPSPAKIHFFEEQMDVLEEMAEIPALSTIPEIDQDFGPATLDEEDLALAEEADEMSLLDPELLIAPGADEDMFAMPESEIIYDNEAREVVETVELVQAVDDDAGGQEELLDPTFDEEILIAKPDSHELETAVSAEPEITPYMQQSFEQALSEASQEYGDENAVPIEPSLMPPPPPAVPEAPSYNTPKQVLRERTFHTVSKVPLKPAAEHTPMRPSPLKRSASISRLPSQRPTSNLTRKNTVISYSPTKSTPRAKPPSRDVEATPKGDWSTTGTPARTPRRDLNTQLLKGAVVFVDVHTTEGADASVLFTELLTQMGARCVKSWNWNANDDGSKIGITHVVFKDGGKRTIEKVRETNGVVSCVGVGWVLDCERENEWLPESPYAVDTALVPRGGHRRRKSMEPKAIANLNGTIVSSNTPSRASSYSRSNANTPMTSKSRRRESVQWVRSSPASDSPDVTHNSNEDFVLTPVSTTPGLQIYTEEGLDGYETPGAQTPYFLKKGELMQQTAPVRRFVEGDDEGSTSGSGWLSEKKDESVMMRLMAARRKSLQWAPKIGSPLARS